jgi:hypothetical protein
VPTGGVSTGGVGQGGFAGHTAQCIGNPCGPGCGTCAGRGGFAGEVGRGGDGAFAGSGFAGHTASCMINRCDPSCPGYPCAGQGGAGGAQAGDAGRSGGGGFAGLAGFAGQARSAFAELPSEEHAASPPAAPSSGRGCYVLAGVDGDPCLPADDAVLAWLDARRVACEPRVAAGPFDEYDGNVRRCCYSLACETRSSPANRLPNGLR